MDVDITILPDKERTIYCYGKFHHANILIKINNNTGKIIPIDKVFIGFENQEPYRCPPGVIDLENIYPGQNQCNFNEIVKILKFKNALFDKFYIEIISNENTFKSNTIDMIAESNYYAI